METALLAKHQGRAHKLAIEPGSPHIFYTCGEDGLVQHVSYVLPFQFLIMGSTCELCLFVRELKLALWA